MEQIDFRADWDRNVGVMVVTMFTPDDTFVDRLDRPAWDTFVAGLDAGPITICGLTVKFDLPACEPKYLLAPAQVEATIKNYFRRVDRALRETGQTRLLPEAP